MANVVPVETAVFDVFDTCLIRLLGAPEQVFVETGRRLRAQGTIAVSPAAFAAVREHSAAGLLADVAVHPSLKQVTDELGSRLSLDRHAIDTVLETELAVERDACRAVPGMVDHLATERHRTGRGVLFVSDTPLPADFLRDLLEREQLFRDGDQLYTSSGHGSSKQDGGLFEAVRDDQGGAADRFVMTGDDEEADVVNARRYGWRATPRVDGRLSGAEVRLNAQADATDGVSSRLAGASRMGRLRAVRAGADPAVSSIATGVGLPFMVGFGLWVLAQARLRKLDRLYFVSRDGEILLRVTQALAASLGHDIECRYLYGSRRVWQLAARGTASHESTELWLPDDLPGAERTADEVLELVGLTAEEAFELTGEPVFAPGRVSTPLGEDGFAAVRAALDEDALRLRCRQRARERRDLLVRYLDQEGVTGPGAAAIVDVGWTGRASRALEDVLDDATRPLPAAHLFIGLQRAAPTVMGPELFARSHAWLVDEPAGRRLDLRSDEDLVMLVESFTMGSEGSTSGYSDQGGTIVPELMTSTNPAARAWRFDDYRAALDHALDALLDGAALPLDVDLRPVVSGQVLGFWRHPSTAQAQAWGAQPYGEDYYNKVWHPLATPLTARRLLTRAGLGRPDWREPTYWLPGTVAVSPEPWRSVLGSALRHRQIPARLSRVPRRLRTEMLRRRG